MTLRLLRPALVAVAGVCAWLLLAPTQLGGQNTYVVTHGVSMQPSHHTGDLVIVRPQETYRIGDVVAHDSSELGSVVLHRIVDRQAAGYVLKGDNNHWLDSERPEVADLLGRQVVHLPQAGTWLQRLTSPPALAAYTFLLLLAGGRTARTRRQRRKELRAMSPRHRATTSPVAAALPTPVKAVAAAAALTGLAGLALGWLAWTTPTQKSVEAAAGAASSMTFSYTARVPRSAAYDGTTVFAPQPVFRKLTDSVDVTYRYSGAPGRLSVTAQLSTDSGWSSTLPLAAAVDIAAEHQGRISLDLGALEARALRAASTTGLPAGTVMVAVVPAVALADGGTFAPKLELGLDPLALRPLGPLVATGPAATTGTRQEPAQLSLLGRSISVSAARIVALLVCVLAGTVLAVTVVAARLAGPVAEAEAVRRRHRDLILPVMPVALAGGRPVIEVPDVQALVKLAERYGLLVLTWSRGGIDTYLVQDEATTYRYRSGAAAAEQAENKEHAPRQDLGALAL